MIFYTFLNPWYFKAKESNFLCASTNNMSSHSKLSITRSTYLIPYCGQGVEAVLRSCDWRRQKSMKLKALNTLMHCFIQLTKQRAGEFAWPWKIEKSVLLVGSLCAQVGAFAWLLMRHFYFSCAAWWEHCIRFFGVLDQLRRYWSVITQ